MTIRRPSTRLGLLAMLGLSIWVGRGVDIGPINLQSAQVMVAVLLFALLVYQSQARTAFGNRFQPRTLLLATTVLLSITAIVIAGALSAGAALELMSVIRFMARYVLGLALVVTLCTFLHDRVGLARLEGALLAGAVLSVVIGAAGFFLPALGEVTIRYGDRVQALLNDPNQLAIMLSTMVPLALVRALRHPRRAPGWLAVFVVTAGIGFTGSKANLLLLAAVVPLAVLLFAHVRRDVLQRLLGIVVLSIAGAAVGSVAVLVVQAFNPRTLVTIERLFIDPAGISAVTARTDLWTTAITVGLEHPWFGVGADHGWRYLAHGHAHNVVMEFFLTLGIVGLVALAALLSTVLATAGVSIWTALTRSDLHRGDRLGLIGYPMACAVYIIGNMSSDSFGGTTLPVLWIGVSMTLAQLDIVGRQPRRCARAVHAHMATSSSPSAGSAP